MRDYNEVLVGKLAEIRQYLNEMQWGLSLGPRHGQGARLQRSKRADIDEVRRRRAQLSNDTRS